MSWLISFSVWKIRGPIISILSPPLSFSPQSFLLWIRFAPAFRSPIVYNCGGYERPEIVEYLKDYVDIWLPDLKYHDSALSARLSNCGNYFEAASRATYQMILQTGAPVFEEHAPEEPSQPSFLLMKKA